MTKEEREDAAGDLPACPSCHGAHVAVVAHYQSQLHRAQETVAALRLARERMEAERDEARRLAEEWRDRGCSDSENPEWYPFPWETE